MSEEGGRSLTRREFDAVIRRAAELATSDSEAEAALTEGELYRIAGEVGLSPSHVRRALLDVRSGAEADGILDRLFGPKTIRASRVVAGHADDLREDLDEFLVASRLLQPVRRGVGLLHYQPSVDWASQLARAASFSSRKYYIASAKSVEIRLEEVDDDRTLVEWTVDPGTRKDDILGGVFGGGAAAGVAGVASGAVLASMAPLAVAIGGGILVGAGVWTAIGAGMAYGHRRKVAEVRTEVEGVLDSLETGMSLEPPPPSWRRWVKRQFHGVARDITRHEDD